jgi:hypothetical protein
MDSDLRRTLTELQFWCQFGVGDRRCGGEWIDWGGKPSNWLMSEKTLRPDTEWRQIEQLGESEVLGTMEEMIPNLNLEQILMPSEIQCDTRSSWAVLKVLEKTEDYIEALSFFDITVDQQFTSYEVTAFQHPCADDPVTKTILRGHPGRRFEPPQGTECRIAPSSKSLARYALDLNLGFLQPQLSSDRIIKEARSGFYNPRRYLTRIRHLISRYLLRQEILDPLDPLLYISNGEDRFLPTVGTMHTLETIVVDLVPQLRHILRSERSRKMNPEQMLLENVWSNKRVTRRTVKQEQQGKKSYFENIIDGGSVLKTWLEVCNKENLEGRIDTDQE